MRFLYSVCVLCVLYVTSVSMGPAHPPTKGAVWPKPKSQIFQQGYYKFDPETFNVEIAGHNCTILANRIRHYIYEFSRMKELGEKYRSPQQPPQAVREKRQLEHIAGAADQNSEGHDSSASSTTSDSGAAPAQLWGGIHTLRVDLRAPCEKHPHLDMDESYNLTVTTSALLTSNSIWGIIRGLETFSQLFYFTDDFQEIRINASEIYDAPAYKHRGLLLDTARHYIPVRDILTTIDALSINKMNVFHWHIVDDQSFPYQSERFPDLSARGAYHSSMVYTKSDIEMIINYATERGVRVIPELDTPGHVQSWGEGYPNLLTECYADGKVSKLGPINPIQNTTYKFLRELFQEVQDLFPDHSIHVGGDEVDSSCWQSNPNIQKWMREHDMRSASKLNEYFMSRFLPLLQPRSDVIVWQEIFDEGVPLDVSRIIQVWQNWNDPGWHMYRALRRGHRVLFSAFWYLDHLGQTFEKMLQTDPRTEVENRRRANVNLDNLIGGEACMWSEIVDDTNLHSRVWPRASAVAERLWSGPPVDTSELSLRRAEEHACRMRRRGVPSAPPAGPGFCLY